jgi:hypothetical protein
MCTLRAIYDRGRKSSDGTLAAPGRIHGPVWVVAPELPGP